MWRPKERIKYTASAGKWPSAAQAADSLLFSPLSIGRLKLNQRTWVPAMVPWRASEEGELTPDVLDWYQRFAEGQPGAIVIEATGIRDIASGPLLRISNDSHIPGLRKLVDTIRKASDGNTKVFIQIIDFLSIRKRPNKEKYLQRFLEITDRHRELLEEPDDDKIRAILQTKNDDELAAILSSRELEALTHGYRERVTDTHLPWIVDLPERLPTLFAQAAQRAEQAGFDGVELHYAHAYTMSSFLSRTNTREDGYGGEKENRAKLALEVFHNVRASVNSDFIVGCRFLSDEIINNGSDVEDAVYFAKQFATAGMDFISVSRGGKFDDAKQPKVGAAAYPYTGQSGYECMPQYVSDKKGPFGRNLPASEQIKKSLNDNGFDVPLITAGGIHNFEQAEKVLQDGQADVIAYARQALADPDWFRKVKNGDGDKVIICRYSNYCEALDQKHKQVTCELWDRTKLDEAGITKSLDGKRRLVAPREYR